MLTWLLAGGLSPFTGRWWEGSVPHHVGLSIGLLGCPCDMAAGFSQKGIQEESKEEAPVPSMI